MRLISKVGVSLGTAGLIIGAQYWADGHIPGCNIKGNLNVSTGERIYHLPSHEYYGETWVDSSKGERWFCTEDEARNAGWRRSRV